MLASAISGFFANFSLRKSSAIFRSRLNNQHTRPRANMLRHFSIALLSIPVSARQSFTIWEIGAAITSCLIPISSIGLSVLKAAFCKSEAWKQSVSMMIQAVDLANLYCVFNAAAFIATNTSHLSPGVNTLLAPMCTWKPDTPVREPCGARISAG